MIKAVGIMGNIFRYLPNSIYGYDIAVKDALAALLRYGTYQTLVVHYDPRQYQEYIIRKTVKEMQDKGLINREVVFVSTYDLLKGNNQTHIDVMHNVGMEFLPQLYFRENVAIKPFPYIYTLHCASSPNYRYDFFLQKLLSPFRQFDSLICTSEASKKAVQTILENTTYFLAKEKNIYLKYDGRLDVIPLGVDTNYFYPLNVAQKRRIRTEYNIPYSAFVMLWMGRVSALDKADIQPLIMVLHRLILQNHDKQIILVIAGYDKPNLEFIPAIKAYAESLGVLNNLVFTNPEQSQRNEIYNLAEVFVAPTDNVQETFGLAPIEAMACGIPQVVADWDGYRDTVTDGVTGFRVPTLWTNCDNTLVNNPMLPVEPILRGFLHGFILSQTVSVDLDLYENAIQKLIDSPKMKEQQSINSVMLAKKKFDWKNIIEYYEQLWNTLHEDCLNHGSIQGHKMQYITPHYCEEFASYPTDFLDTDSLVAITVEGSQVLNGEIELPAHYKFEPLLFDSNERLSLLWIISEKEKTVRAIKKETQDSSLSMPVEAHIMWLLKNGFVRLRERKQQ